MDFWTKLGKRGLKQKQNITIEFYIFEIVQVPIKGTSDVKKNKMNQYRFQISTLTNNFDFLRQICPKKDASIDKEKE